MMRMRAATGLFMACGICGTGCYRSPDALVCPPDNGTLADLVETSPRPDTNLELLALHIDNGSISIRSGQRRIVARQETYDRVVRDVAAARALEPELFDVTYFPRNDGRSLNVSLSRGAFAKFERGEYDALDCFFGAYGGDIVGALPPPNPNLTDVHIRFDGIYDLYSIMDQIVGDVPQIHGATSGRFDEHGLSAPREYGPTICVQGRDATWHYVFVDTDGPCEGPCTTGESYYLTTEPSGSVMLRDVFTEGTGATPPWWIDSFRNDSVCGGPHPWP